MNQTRKNILLVALLGLILLSLTACGSNKLVATKSTTILNTTYNERVEVSFKNNKANKIVWTLQFENETYANSYSRIYKSMSSNEFDIKQDGSKIIMTLDSDAFAKLQGNNSDDTSKKAMQKTLEDSGYTIEK